MRKTVKIATAGVITALSVIFLLLGSVIWIFSYIMPLLCGIIMMIICESFDKKTAVLIYLSVGVLSLILLPSREASLLYIMLIGYYPIIIDKLNSINLFPLRVLIKLLIFNSTVISAELICTYVFGIPFDNLMGKTGIIILIISANVLLFVYDKLLVILNLLYVKRYKNRIEKFLK